MTHDRYRHYTEAFVKIAKWPAIGGLIAGGALLVGRLVGPSVADQLGGRAGEGFARGVAEAQAAITSSRHQVAISGWGTYRQR